MKIILSRKGFDAQNGCMPSPILDSEMISMPIPVEQSHSQYTFQDLMYNGITYRDLLSKLKGKLFENLKCHLDPDIRLGIRDCKNWQPAYGQVRGSQTHLMNQGVSLGDLFLFFGWFRNTTLDKYGNLRFSGPHIQAIYGYLQIGEILQGSDIQMRYPWHPHAIPEDFSDADNTLYLPSRRLSFDGCETDLPGYGVLKFRDNLILTKPGMSRYRWKLLPWMHKTTISCHNSSNIKSEYFQSAAIGQEFVIQDNSEASDWARSIIFYDGDGS